MKYKHFEDIRPNHRTDFVMLYFAACRSLRELEAETNKLNDVPADIAKYVKPADNSGLKRAILELGNKMIAVDELIKSETTTSTKQMKPFEWWKY